MKAFRGECYILPNNVDEVIKITHIINKLGYGWHGVRWDKESTSSDHTLYYAKKWWKYPNTLRYFSSDGKKISLSGYPIPEYEEPLTTAMFISKLKGYTLTNKLKEYLNESR